MPPPIHAGKTLTDAFHPWLVRYVDRICACGGCDNRRVMAPKNLQMWIQPNNSPPQQEALVSNTATTD